MRELKTFLQEFWRQRAGVSAIEFAFGAPMMILLMLMAVDVTRYVVATKRVENVATTIGEMIARTATGTGTATVNYRDLQFFHDSTMVIFPQVLADAKQQNLPWSSDIAITVSSVDFTPTPSECTSNCTYTTQLLWSGGTNPRSCTVPMTPTSDTAIPSRTTLPSDLFGPVSQIVVDVVFSFRPTIASRYLPTMSIARSYYVAPRYVPVIKYAVITGDNGIAAECPNT